MREIARIHIAKVAYDIELDAKKDIESYISALELYASDPEILDDIEIRITELLQERGVVSGGVIDASDVAAVRAQLGEPSDFASEDAVHNVSSQNEVGNEPRRVYRDENEGVVGGVLAGFAKFFGIDPLWVRLLFIVLLFASFGTALVVYLILWIIIPPAKTAADRLRMSGQAVTLNSIKELVGSEEQRNKRARTTRRLMSGLGGVVMVVLAIGGLVGVVAALASTQFGFGAEYTPVADWQLGESLWFTVMMGLFALSGILFSALCFLLASALFSRRWTKRIGIATVAIISAGLVIFASGVGVAISEYFNEQARIHELRQAVRADLPIGFRDVKTLIIDDDGASEGVGRIEYIASNETRYELEALPGIESQFEISDDGLSATVRLVSTGSEPQRPWSRMVTPVLKIYGPTLEGIETANDSHALSYYSEQSQPQLNVAVHSGSHFKLGGRYDEVNVVSQARSFIGLDEAAIGKLSVNSRAGIVEAGVVRDLEVKQPDACEARQLYGHNHYVRVQAVSSGNITHNGVKRAAETTISDCGAVFVGDDENESYSQSLYR